MAILVPRWLDSSWQVRLQMCLKVCMVIFANRTRAQTRSAITPMFLLEDLRSAQNSFIRSRRTYSENFAAHAEPPCQLFSASTSALAQEVDQRHATKPDL